MLPIHTILHPTDFSEGALYAFRLASALAHDYGARLIVLHVAPPIVSPYVEGVIPPPVGYLTELNEQLIQLQPKDRRIDVEHRLVEGDPAREILDTAEETHCDVILMGTHGRTGLRRLLMGSVAEEVLRHASCPVVTVRAPVAAKVPVEEAEVAAV